MTTTKAYDDMVQDKMAKNAPQQKPMMGGKEMMARLAETVNSLGFVEDKPKRRGRPPGSKNKPKAKR